MLKKSQVKKIVEGYNKKKSPPKFSSKVSEDLITGFKHLFDRLDAVVDELNGLKNSKEDDEALDWDPDEKKTPVNYDKKKGKKLREYIVCIGLADYDVDEKDELDHNYNIRVFALDHEEYEFWSDYGNKENDMKVLVQAYDRNGAVKACLDKLYNCSDLDHTELVIV